MTDFKLGEDKSADLLYNDGKTVFFCLPSMRFRPSRDVIKKILLCLLTFSGYFLGIAFFIHSQTLFLEKIGPAYLPFVMAMGAGLIIVYSLISSFIGSRVSAPLRFAIFALLISAFYGVIYFLPQNVPLQILLLFLTSGFWFDFLEISVVNVSLSLMTPLQAKNILPLLNSFNSLGVIAGSYFALEIQQYSEKMGLGLLPAISLLIVVVLALLIVRIFKRDLGLAVDLVQGKHQGPVTQLKEASQFVFRQSRLFKTLALVIFLVVTIQVSVEFKVKTSLSLHYTGEELTILFSQFYIVESALTFFIDLFFTKWLLYRFGVSRLILAYPVVMLAFLGLAVAFGLQPLFVVIFALSSSVPWYAVVSIATSQIFSIAPKQKAQQAYFLIMGLLSSVTKVVISLFLIIYSLNIELEQTWNTGFLVFFILILLISVFKFRKHYQTELSENLFKENVYLKHQAIELLAEKTQRDLGEVQLRRLLNLRGTDEETKFKTMNSLGIIGNYQTITDFIDILKKGHPREMFAAIQAIDAIIQSRKQFDHYPITKHLLLKTYREIFISNAPHYIKLEIISSLKYFNLEEIVDFLEKSLQSDDTQVKINVIETLATFNDRGIILYLDPYLNSNDLRLVASAVAALWKFVDLRICLVPRLVRVLAGKTFEAEASALFLIGSIGAFWEKNFVRRCCESENPHIRHAAIVTMIKLGEKKYFEGLISEFVALSKTIKKDQKASDADELEVEFILSQYRRFCQKDREAFISKIQQLSPGDVSAVYEAFLHSRYMFGQELDDLRG